MNDAIDFSRLGPPKGSRVAIVGGCGGIGKSLAAACETLQLRTAVLDLPAALEKNEPPGHGSIALPIDVTCEDTIVDCFDRLRRHFGGLDVLVLVTGIGVIPPKSIMELTSRQWDDVMQVNLKAAWLCARQAIPLMDQGGSIVTIASSLAFNPNRGSSAYVASKGGLVSFTKAIAVENAPRIRANVVAPSAVDTPFLGSHEDGWFSGWVDNYVASIPLGRLANADDIVGPILFLAGPASRYVTGQVIHVNGGRITP